ncbi:hypothetical protein [Novosphingobium sp.]|uniref:hypothetical protein n=1 Tax=Novosphingobium sp. TaxID=1874826 RepID=UPI0027366E02|nr:hypothetical protein [Novosphingobium sp.]MDP3906333.1 hypothetical protein [Novosphingobium sp.]
MTKAISPPGVPVPVRTPRSRGRRIKLAPALRAAAGETSLNKHWRTYFLAALVETSCVKASAAVAGISPTRAYRARREDPAFAAQWRTVLAEGYENLELELLAYLRNPDPARKLDVANALRLLAHHRTAKAEQRAPTDDRSEQEVLDSIDAMIDQMRERAAANAALLAEPDGDHGGEGELGAD